VGLLWFHQGGENIFGIKNIFRGLNIVVGPPYCLLSQ